MTIIAISGVPAKMHINEFRERFIPPNSNYFKNTNFYPKFQGNTKTFYLDLRLRAHIPSVMPLLHYNPWVEKMNLQVYITDVVPMVLSEPGPVYEQSIPVKKNKFKPKKANKQVVKTKFFKTLRMQKEAKHQQSKQKWIQKKNAALTPFKKLSSAHTELMTELQSKFTKLFNLSFKTNHELLEKIAWKLCERLLLIINTDDSAMENEFVMTKAYRRRYKHFTDYPLIMQTLHSIQDAAGIPRTEVTEAELIKVTVQPAVLGDLPFDVVNGISSKFCTKITNAICKYISNVDCMPHQMDSPDTAARKKIQQILKKMLPHMSMLIQQMTKNKMVPSTLPYHRCKMYGEPFLPTRDNTAPILSMFKPVHMRRSDRIYNMIKFNVPITKFAGLMEWDGKDVAGATIRIRSSDIPKYISAAVTEELRRMYGNAEELAAAENNFEIVEDGGQTSEMEVEEIE